MNTALKDKLLTSASGLLAITLYILLILTTHFAVNAAPGDLDPSFSGDGRLIDMFGGDGEDVAKASVRQPDGKIVVAGHSGFRCTLVRHNADGSLDTSFGDQGIAVIPVEGSVRTVCNAVSLQLDGKIVAGGHFIPTNQTENLQFLIYRLNADGSLDNGFGMGGMVMIPLSNGNDIVHSIVVQPDGKILAGGIADEGFSNTGNFAIVRLNTDGTFDTTFDSDGIVSTAFSFQSRINSLAIQTGGKIVAAGALTGTLPGFGEFALARYNADGTLDTGFGTNGTIVTPNTGDILDVVIQPDGKIVGAGIVFSGSSYNFLLARYNTDGTLDQTFGGTGLVMTSVTSGGDGASSVVLQPDGKIVAGGSASQGPNDSNLVLVRYNPNGGLDPTFGSGGISAGQVVPSREGLTDLLLLPDGKFIGTASIRTGNDNDFSISRFNASGGLDTAFGAGGRVLLDIGDSGSGQPSNGRAVAIQTDGKIVAVGGISNGQDSDFLVARYNANGTRDLSFGGTGRVKFPVMTREDLARAVAIQPDGKIVVAGSAQTTSGQDVFALARLNTDGTLDASFGTAGIVTTTAGTTLDGIEGMALQPDGKIVAVGTSTVGNDTDFVVARYNTNGSLDTSFAGGRVVTTILTSFDYGRAVAIQADGKIVAGGYADIGGSDNEFTLVRYNTDGTLDTSFDTDGKALIPMGGMQDIINSLAVQPDGKIVAGGSTGPDALSPYNCAVARINPNGSLDTAFGTGGKLITALSKGHDEVRSIAVQADGKIVAAGSTDELNPVIRYNSNGSLDTSFGAAGIALFGFSADNAGDLRGLALDSAGRATLVGVANSFIALARLNGDSVAPGGRAEFDFDGDGRSDIGVFRSSDSNWYINRSQAGFLAMKWGLPKDKLAPADYDGDGKTDIAVWREDASGGQAYFYIVNSSTGQMRSEPFGITGDKLIVGDWDGDGKADPAVYRDGPQSYIYYRGSLNNPSGSVSQAHWGTSGDRPLVGDFDGDGRLDEAVYRGSDQTTYIRNSSNGQITYTVFGLSTDIFVPADYDGDSKADIAVFRPSDGTWYILQSSNGQVRYERFGSGSDIPAAADYDGDGRADIAVYRGGQWIIMSSSNGAVSYETFGLAADAPVPASFLH